MDLNSFLNDCINIADIFHQVGFFENYEYGCMKCNSEVDPDATVCPKCGEVFDETVDVAEENQQEYKISSQRR